MELMIWACMSLIQPGGNVGGVGEEEEETEEVGKMGRKREV